MKYPKAGKGMTTTETAYTERFWARVAVTPGCWLWQAGKSADGYGRFSYQGKSVTSHGFAYQQLVGLIPDGLELDHLCRVRECVNPSHMEPVTHKENLMRGISPSAIHAEQTHCAQGHPYSEDNTYLRPTGTRRCKTCERVHSAEYVRKNR